MSLNKLTDEEWQEKIKAQKIKRLNWVIENIGSIAEELDLWGSEKERWDIRKLDCHYIAEWEWYSHDSISLTFYPYLGSNGLDVKIHEEDLDKFIKKYLEGKNEIIVKEKECIT